MFQAAVAFDKARGVVIGSAVGAIRSALRKHDSSVSVEELPVHSKGTWGAVKIKGSNLTFNQVAEVVDSLDGLSDVRPFVDEETPVRATLVP